MAAAQHDGGDPRLATQAYLQAHQLPGIMHTLLAELLFAKPADPVRHIVAALERMRVVGAKPLLGGDDFAVMHRMLDVRQSGGVSEAQADSALRTLLGPSWSAPSSAAGAGQAAVLDQRTFVAYMQQAVCAATPLCKQTAAAAGAPDSSSTDESSS